MRNRLMLAPLALLVAACTVSVLHADTLTLQAGAVVAPYADEFPGDTYRYYGCQDTLIDPANPDANFGRLTVHGLTGGTTRKVLIQFRELHRALGPGKQISSARILLHTVPGAWTTGNGVRVYPLLRTWRQGSMTDADPQPQHWTSSYDYALYSEDSSEAQQWAVPGAAGVGVDRAADATVTTSTGTLYNPTAQTWMIVGLAADVAQFYANSATNFGWVIEYTDASTAAGENLFYTSEAAEIDLRPELLIHYADADPVARDVDLDVTYIARTPEYYRYEPVYENGEFHDEGVGMLKYPGYADTQKWPENGDTVTFSAHVINKGLNGTSGPFTYRWLLNGELLSAGEDTTGLAAGQERSYTLDWAWDANDYLDDSNAHCKSRDHRDRVLTFVVDPEDTIAEHCENNNALGDFLEAPGMGFWVEQSMYDMFNATLNQTGSYSFEDWLQWCVRVWNESFLEMSRFAGFAEDGCLERVRVQHIGIVPDGVLCVGGNHIPNCQTDFLLDGEWGFRPDLGYVQKWSRLIEGALLHECTHQLGMIDLYSMNMEAGTPSTPMRVQVKDGLAHYITRGYYPPWGGLMGGGDTRYSPDYEATGLMSGWTIGAFNSNVGYRRGFYGEELYDVPDVVRLRALDASGEPIPNAEFKIWQSRGGSTPDETLFDWQPIFEGAAGADGVATLPSYGTLDDGFTTITGHTLKPNPWGRINVVGTNGSLLVKVVGYGQRDYTFVRISQINRVYWSGDTDETTYDLTLQIAPTYNLGLENIAVGASAAASAGNPALAIDDDLDTRWDPGVCDVGAFIQVDLGEPADVANVVLVQNGWGGDFFERFRIETSLTGAFGGEQVLFAGETIGWGLTSGTRRDIDPDNESVLAVNYAGLPLPARYVRITCEAADWTRLAELRIYPALPGDDTTPPARVTDLLAGDVASTAALLSWTTPGDDGWIGTASSYDVRYADFQITAANFSSATPVPETPTPYAGSTLQDYRLPDLEPGTRYWVALKACDDMGNWSDLSNVATFTTVPAGGTLDFATLSTPVDSSFASALASDGMNLYYLRRDSYAFYRSSDDGESWQQLARLNTDLGGWHGNWCSGVLSYCPDQGAAGRLYAVQSDTSDVVRLVRYDVDEDYWSWTATWAVFSHGTTRVGDYLYGITHAFGWNTGGAVQRIDLTDLPAYADRTGLGGIEGESYDWLSRAAQLTSCDDMVYGIKNDWATPDGTGDRVFGFAAADFEPSVFTGSFPDQFTHWDLWQTHATPTVDYGRAPFEIGYGSVVIALPPQWMPGVGSQGGLFIMAGNSPSDNEGWGPPSDLYAVLDIATQTFATGTLPGVSGNGASAVLHDGAIVIKRGASPDYNTDLWIVTPGAPPLCAGDVNCDGVVDYADIDMFVAALGYAGGVGWPHACPWLSADCDGDGAVTYADIDAFVARIGAVCP